MNAFLLKHVCLNTTFMYFSCQACQEVSPRGAVWGWGPRASSGNDHWRQCPLHRWTGPERDWDIQKSAFNPIRTGGGWRGTACPYCLYLQTHTCVYRPHRHHLRGLSCAEHAISQERCHILPEKELLKYEAVVCVQSVCVFFIYLYLFKYSVTFVNS